jgi:hypothetical protein
MVVAVGIGALLLGIGFGTARGDEEEPKPEVSARLSGFDEIPAVLTGAAGRFAAKVDATAQLVEYELQYRGLSGDALFAHIHFGQRFANGGVIVFLCNNDPSIPTGAPACPAREGTVTGTFGAADILGPAGQGIAPGDFEGFLRVLRRRLGYANVHSTRHPGGEIRGQVR